MKPYSIKTYRAEDEVKNHTFYILNKGINSGKPLKRACPNCYSFTTESAEDYEFYYWICYGLYISKKFQRELIGSVILYIRIGDAKKLIHDAAQKIYFNQNNYSNKVKILLNIEEKERLILEQTKAIKQLKRAILQPFF